MLSLPESPPEDPDRFYLLDEEDVRRDVGNVTSGKPDDQGTAPWSQLADEVAEAGTADDVEHHVQATGAAGCFCDLVP